MNCTPDEPSEASGQPQATEIDDRLLAPDRRQITKIPIAERRRGGSAREACGDSPSDIGAFLFLPALFPAARHADLRLARCRR